MTFYELLHKLRHSWELVRVTRPYWYYECRVCGARKFERVPFEGTEGRKLDEDWLAGRDTP